MRDQLKLAILRKYRYQVDFAMGAGMDEHITSRIVHGRRDPTEDQRLKMAAALDISPEELDGLLKNEIPKDTRPR